MARNILGAIIKAYQEVGIDNPDVVFDIKYGYLTENEARNGRCVIWYLDAAHNVAVYVDTLEVLSDKEIDEQLT